MSTSSTSDIACEEELQKEVPEVTADDKVATSDNFKKVRLLVHAGAQFNDTEISEDVRLKRFGASAEEMKNWSALQRMGLTQSEMELGNSIRMANPSLEIDTAKASKVEKMTGASMAEMKRAKAVLTLGSSEQEIEESRAKRLGQIGKNNTSHW